MHADGSCQGGVAQSIGFKGKSLRQRDPSKAQRLGDGREMHRRGGFEIGRRARRAARGDMRGPTASRRSATSVGSAADGFRAGERFKRSGGVGGALHSSDLSNVSLEFRMPSRSDVIFLTIIALVPPVVVLVVGAALGWALSDFIPADF